MRRTGISTAWLATVLSAACAVAPAFAGDLITAHDPQAILEVAKGFGSAQLKKDPTGDPLIAGRIDGTKYGIVFYGCEHGKNCDEVQFAAGWSGAHASLEALNRFNQTKKYGRAYLDSDGDPRLDMVVNLDHGVSVENFEDTFNWWTRALANFRKEVLDD